MFGRRITFYQFIRQNKSLDPTFWEVVYTNSHVVEKFPRNKAIDLDADYDMLYDYFNRHYANPPCMRAFRTFWEMYARRFNANYVLPSMDGVIDNYTRVILGMNS